MSGPAPEEWAPGPTLPYSAEAEQAVLGAVLNGDADTALLATELLSDWMFYREGHRKLFRAMLTLVRTDAVDPITVKDELLRRGELDDVGGVDYLSYLLDVVPTSANLEYHARIVRDKAKLRRLIEVGTQIVQDAYNAGKPAAEICEAAEQRIFSVVEDRSDGNRAVMVKNLLWPAMERIEARHGADVAGGTTGVPSGFVDLDERTAGFQPGDLVVVAARPSMGKTAFCLNVAGHVAIEREAAVAVFSLEMSKQALTERLLTSEARVDAHRLRSGCLGEADYRGVAKAAGILSNARILIDDTGNLSPLELRARARRLAAEHDKLSLVIVDYLQLMREPEYRGNRVQEVSAISRALKALAKELNVPVMALSQLSRAPEQRGGEGRRPQLSDLRESGGIEQDADTVLFIYRAEMYARDEVERDQLRGQAEIIIGKQRNGPTGTVKLAFHAQYTRFDNYSDRDGVNERGQQQAIQLVPPPRIWRTRMADE